MIRKFSTTVETTGGAGAAAGEGFIQLTQQHAVLKVALDYTGEPATTDVTITDTATGETILSRANSATDGVFYVRVPAAKSDGTASTLTEVPPITERLKVAVAQGDPAGTVAVSVFASIDE